jgi:hypothetical protein
LAVAKRSAEGAELGKGRKKKAPSAKERTAAAPEWALVRPGSGKAGLLVERVIDSYGPHRGEKKKISASVNAALWEEMRSLVDDEHAAESASAAVEQGAALWIANQRLRKALAEQFQEEPGSRPSDEQLQRARELLGVL